MTRIAASAKKHRSDRCFFAVCEVFYVKTELKTIAKIHSDFPEKFGIPRQSGLADNISFVVFEPAYRAEEALRGIESYSHLWLLWHFSKNGKAPRSLTVRPPKLGGNTRLGVFATRSPFRPNPIGLSSVKLVEVKRTKDLGTVLAVSGADLADGTPIFDIKPYLAYTDSHPEAVGGFADKAYYAKLSVSFAENVQIPEDKKKTLVKILENDPRPSYQNDPDRVYGMKFSHYEVKFKVENSNLTVLSVAES